MGDPYHVYIFGDQTFDYSRGLRDLVRLSSDPLLIHFFESVYVALREEVGNLPQYQRQKFARFSNFSELAALSRNPSLHPSLDHALSCAYQLALFISEQSKERSYLKASNSCISGLCTGALAAAAICSSTSVTNLLPAAVHSVRVSFRTGQCALEVGQNIVAAAGGAVSEWSVMFLGMTAEEAREAIEALSCAKNLPITSRPFLSVISDHGAAISGPPCTLLDMQNDPVLSKYTTVRLPLQAPYHAPHLFSGHDIDPILSTKIPDRWASQLTAIPPISSATGEFIWASDFLSLLRVAIEGILLKPLRWDQLFRRLGSIAGSTVGATVIVHPIALPADRAIRGIKKQCGPNTSLLLDRRHALGPSDAVDSATGYETPTKTSLNHNMSGRPDKSKIAVIGASGRIPDAEDLSAFWELLYEGRDVHKVVPPLHWDANTHVDATGKSKNTSSTPFGCWLDHPELFDAKFFNISPREAPQIDPAQRLALMTAYEAIEDAGIVSEATPSTQKDRVGVFYGVTSNDWMETNSAQKIDTYFIPGGNRAFIPGRINYFFNFSGPSCSVDTACSSSLAAIHVACNALWRGEVDTAIAGGTNVLKNPDFTAGLDRGHFLSRTGNCKTFDDSADGYCRGEGVATVVLKRLEDALADKDPIQALISGAYTNHSAEAESITRPLVAAQKDIFRKILNAAGTDPYDITYVEMHGTGTQAGDGAEMRSVLDIFAPDNSQRRSDDQALYVGSAKANVGHGEAASGAISLVKLLLMMRHGIIPPHCGIKTKLNHTFPNNLDERRVFIASEPTPWKRPQNGVRKAFLNNFSAAGGNTALLLEDAPTENFEEDHDQRSNQVVAVSAKCAASLEGNVSNLLSFLDTVGDAELPQLSWTTTARRMHHPHRVMVYGDNIEKIKARFLQAVEAKSGSTRPKSVPKVTFAFTGQGSAYPGMAGQLFDELSSFRTDIRRFDSIARKLGFSSFISYLITSADEKTEYLPSVTQLALVCFEMALARLWLSWGIVPHMVVGHSIGEYAALNIAGVISDADTIYLTGKRAQLLQQHCVPDEYSMLAVKASLSEVQGILSDAHCEIACINSPNDVVIGGRRLDIQNAKQILAASTVRASVLNLPYAFHSAQVDPILSELEEAAHGVSYYAPAIPVLSPLQASVIREKGVFGPNYISRHCRQPVDILGAWRAAQDNGVVDGKMAVLEIGPHPVVSTMIQATSPGTEVLPCLKRKVDLWEVIASTISTLYMAGVEIVWREFHRDFKGAHKVMRLPAYKWDLKKYWMQYVNDWSLRKGDPLVVQPTPSYGTTASAPTPPRPESTTIHRFVEETVNGEQGTIVVESDISRSDLNPMVQGHKVNGIPLCTPSVYADIALSLGEYLHGRYWLDIKDHGVVVSDMVIEKALIAAASGPQLLRTTVDLNSKEKTAKCRFSTVEASGKQKAEHASCIIRFRDPGRILAVQRQVPAIKARIDHVRQGLRTGRTYMFNKPMIYKMVSTLAQFDPNYRALEEVILDSTDMEASSVANFAAIKEEGRFHTNPAYIDALSQSAGFVMNANDRSNLEVEVFVNHGWSAFQLFEKLSPLKTYQTHVVMVEQKGKMWTGDILVLDEDRIVASFEGIALQGVARRLLHYILSTESVAQSGSRKDDINGPKSALEKIQPIPKTHLSPQGSEPPKASMVESRKPTRDVIEEGSQHVPVTSHTAAPKSAKTSQSHVQESADLSNESSRLITKALQIISEESGIASEELTDTTVLTDVGIDSLLSLMISSRFKDELALEFEASVFHDLDTIRDLKVFLTHTPDDFQVITAANTGTSPSLETRIDSTEQEKPRAPLRASSQLIEQKLLTASSVEKNPVKADSHDQHLFMKVVQIISEETGIAVSEITDDTEFTDAGIDSLLSLMISARLREELNLDINIDGSLFHDCPTVRDLRVYFESVDDKKYETVLATPSSASNDSSAEDIDDESFKVISETSEGSVEEEYLEIAKPAIQCRRATSMILQGRPWLSSKTLFLFPDGAGSASSYANLPGMHATLAVIGLNCPYVRHPAEMTCPLDELIKSYLSEIRRRQPRGPYNLGGWSAGGILAYRAAQMLTEDGENVEGLVLIDSPVPKGLDRLPQRFYDHCESIGLFGKALPGASPLPSSQLFAHFDATIEVLHDYYAKPLPLGRLKKVTVIWATDCVMDGVHFPKLPPGPDDTEGLKFLTEPRTDFTTAGWEKLFPGTVVEVKRAVNAHHFSMMQGSHALKLSQIVCDALDM